MLRKLTVVALMAIILVGFANAEPGQTQYRLSELLDAGPASGFPKANSIRRFKFPADHGPHPEYRNEWWYATGNLDGAGGRRFGFELTFFRFALTPEPVVADSAWRSRQLFIAHLAVTDVAGERFLVAQKTSRGALGVAGAESQPFRVWIDDWSMRANPRDGVDRWQLQASDDEFGLRLSMSALKPPVLNGDRGLSRKSVDPGNASYYYSMPRWTTDGEITIDAERFEVSGLSWLDREWSSSALSSDQQGWDWFALQFADGEELMFYQLRRNDGSVDPHSAGTWIDADGMTTHLSAQDVELSVTDHWQNDNGSRYPARWTLSVPTFDVSVDVVPVLADQELTTIVRYWEGAVDVEGTRAGEPSRGRGYVELTGYADAIDGN